MRRVLVIAYYYPPAGGPGVQRALKFCHYLPEYGWQPTVITVEGGRFTATDDTLAWDIRPDAEVVRTPSWEPSRWALVDAVRRRKYAAGDRRVARGSQPVDAGATPQYRVLRALRDMVFVPAEQIGWVPGVVREGLRRHRAHRFDAMLTTSAPYSAHVAGLALARATGLPWVADFRDGWLDNPYFAPPTRWRRRLEGLLEQAVLRTARAVTCAPPRLPELLRPKMPAGRGGDVSAITNGYDERDFSVAPMRGPWPVTLVYVGSFFREWSPVSLLRGLHHCLLERPDLRGVIGLSLIGRSDLDNEARITQLTADLGLADAIERPGYLPHKASVARMRGADVLVCVVGRTPEHFAQFPAKTFEYLRAGRPVVCIGPAGPTSDMLAGGGTLLESNLQDSAAIGGALARAADRVRAGETWAPRMAFVEQFERRALTARLAEILDRLAGAQTATARPGGDA